MLLDKLSAVNVTPKEPTQTQMPPVSTPPTRVAPPPASPPLQRENPHHSPVGPTVGIVIIVLLLLLGALYFWGEQLNKNASNSPSYIPGDQVQQ